MAGSRPFEAVRLDWPQVNLRDKEIRLESQPNQDQAPASHYNSPGARRFRPEAVNQRQVASCLFLKVESWNRPVFMRAKPTFPNWNRTLPFHFQKAHQTAVVVGRFHDSTLNPTPRPDNAPTRPQNLCGKTRMDYRALRTSSGDV